MIDWTQPVQVLFGSEWLPATVLKVHGDGSVVVEWRASPTPTLNADVFNDDAADEFIRNTPLKPREFWLLFNGVTSPPAVFSSADDAEAIFRRLDQKGQFKPYSVVHVREVLP